MNAIPCSNHSPRSPNVDFVDLGRIDYESALAIQRAAVEEVIRRRTGSVEGDQRDFGSDGPEVRPWIGRIHLLEHDPPVITVTRRPGAARHVLAEPRRLAELGVELRETDRGGDVTYHGPGQLVVYPILDLNALGLRIHGYMRLLEEVVIRTLAGFGLHGERDATATGVWIDGNMASAPGPTQGGVLGAIRGNAPPTESHGSAKICAMGVRVSRWVSMHGLALNVDPDLAHFALIVPCGLAGRSVTSIARELASREGASRTLPASAPGAKVPSMDEVKSSLRAEFARALDARAAGDAERARSPRPRTRPTTR